MAAKIPFQQAVDDVTDRDAMVAACSMGPDSSSSDSDDNEDHRPVVSADLEATSTHSIQVPTNMQLGWAT